MPRTEKPSHRRASQPLVVSGTLELPLELIPWERDLLLPVLAVLGPAGSTPTREAGVRNESHGEN